MDLLEQNERLLIKLMRRELEDEGVELSVAQLREVLVGNGIDLADYGNADRFMRDGEEALRAYVTRALQKPRPSFVGPDGKAKDILTFASELLQPESYYTSHTIDSLFFFHFEPEWTKRKKDVRCRFAGREEPFRTDEEYSAWTDRWWGIAKGTSRRYGEVFNEFVGLYPGGFADPSHPREAVYRRRQEAWDREQRLYEAALDSLIADYGVSNEFQRLELHIWRGGDLFFPDASIRSTLDEKGRPCVEVRIYAQSVLEKLPASWRWMAGMDDFRFYDLPYIGDRLARDGGVKKTSEPSLRWENRVRTWSIHYLSKGGGGPLTTAEAITEWNRRFPQHEVASGNYERDRKRVLQGIEWWLIRIKEGRARWEQEQRISRRWR